MAFCKKITSSVVITFVLAITSNGVCAQQTAFTYQGALRDNGNPANDLFDMTFSLWDAVAGGSQAGLDIVLQDVVVTDGLFAVDLDFGPEAFTNASRWLQISVEGFILTPRTQITRSPYSVQTRGIFVDSAENIGIGTTSPQAQMHLQSLESTMRMTTIDNSPTTLSRLQFQSAAAPGIFTPLGRLEFLDEQNNVRASITGTAAGATSSILSFNTGPNSPQMTMDGASVEIATNTAVNGDVQIIDSFLHVQNGSAGNVSSGSSTAVFESDGFNSISLLAPDNFQSAIHFGHPSAATTAARITYTPTSDRLSLGTTNVAQTLILTNQNEVEVGGDLMVEDKQWIGTLPGPFDFGQLTIQQNAMSSTFAVDARSDDHNFPSIVASNEGSGGVLWALGGSDVSLSGGGMIVIGDQGGANMGLDRNEIMARNNGQPSTLFLNESGGDIAMGEHRVHPAFAYGKIMNQSIVSASSNVASVITLDLFGDSDHDTYEVTFSSPISNTDIIVASDGSNNFSGFVGVDIENGKLRLRPRTHTGDSFLGGVSFVVYRP